MSSVDVFVTGDFAVPKAQASEKETVVRATWNPALGRRRAVGFVFRILTIASTLAGILILLYLLKDLAAEGLDRVSWDFVTSFPSRFAEKAGIKAALYGSAYLTALTAAFAVPIGVGAAIYLEEFADDTRLRRVIDLNIANLAGVPSIVYGMLGLAIFVRFMNLQRSVISGALTMGILILPIIIVASREALKAIPQSIRQAGYGLGATKWQVVRAHVLPAAAPGILTGIILSVSRAIGETAPLILIGALSYVAFVPESPMDSFTVLPIQIFNWASRPQDEFHTTAAAGIIVLLGFLLLTNGLAVAIRYRAQRKAAW